MTAPLTFVELKTVKTLNGYTAQHRWNHVTIEGGTTGDWTLLGWIRLSASHVKPVYKLVDGRAVILTAGVHHRQVVVKQVVTTSAIQPTEEAAWAR